MKTVNIPYVAGPAFGVVSEVPDFQGGSRGEATVGDQGVSHTEVDEVAELTVGEITVSDDLLVPAQADRDAAVDVVAMVSSCSQSSACGNEQSLSGSSEVADYSMKVCSNSLPVTVDCYFTDDEMDNQSVLDDSLHDSDYVPDSCDDSDSSVEVDAFSNLAYFAMDRKRKHANDGVEPSRKKVSLVDSSNLLSTETEHSSGEAAVGDQGSETEHSRDSVVITLQYDAVSGADGIEWANYREHVSVNVSQNKISNVQTRHSKKKRKIPRPCVFCLKMQTHLNRHIRMLHKHEQSVTDAMVLPYNERNRRFAIFRKQGILKYNQKQMKKCGEAKYARERGQTADSKLVMCCKCSGFFSKAYFRRHRMRCIEDESVPPRSIPARVLSVPAVVSEEFKVQILGCFRSSSTVSELCKSDTDLITFGSRLYNSIEARKDKASAVRKSVMADMRRIGSLFLEFKKFVPNTSKTSDMLRRENFDQFADAIRSYTKSEDTVKAGLKTALYYAINNFATIVRSTHLVSNRDAQAAEVGKFIDVLKLNKKLIFGDAIYLLNKNRQINLRRPQELPSEADVSKMKIYTVDKISQLVGEEYEVWDAHRYAELRNLAACRQRNNGNIARPR